MVYIIISSGSQRLDADGTANGGGADGGANGGFTDGALMVSWCCGIDSSSVDNVTGDGGSVGNHGSG